MSLQNGYTIHNMQMWMTSSQHNVMWSYMCMSSVITFRMFIKYCPNVNDFCHQVFVSCIQYTMYMYFKFGYIQIWTFGWNTCECLVTFIIHINGICLCSSPLASQFTISQSSVFLISSYCAPLAPKSFLFGAAQFSFCARWCSWLWTPLTLC